MERTPPESEFGRHEDGLPDPFEQSDEIRRTGEMKEANRGKFLSTENIPDWFIDIAEERADPLEKEENELTGDFALLPPEYRKEIVDDIQRQAKKGIAKDELYSRFLFLLEQNVKIAKGKGIFPYQEPNRDLDDLRGQEEEKERQGWEAQEKKGRNKVGRSSPLPKRKH